MVDYAKKRFLVIDDQKMARDSLRTVAQNMGAFLVEFSNSYADAINRIRNNLPDVVLCDYLLGDGRSGQQLLEEARRFDLLRDDTVFIMVTGEQAYEQVVSAVELIPDDYLIKPFAPEKLMLRLDRITARKEFFAPFYAAKRQGNYSRALAMLNDALRDADGRAYRFETLRYMAEVQLLADLPGQAELTYRNILEQAPLPWARAGLARALHRQKRLEEAREEIDPVVRQQPDFFDAADLKASICLDQGESAVAQEVLEAIARRTPRNFLRKRLLAEAATLNGDVARANEVLADVLANDSMPGAVTLQDRLALARSQIDCEEYLAAEKTLKQVRESDIQNCELPEQVSYAALLALASPGQGQARFNGLRPALIDTEFPVQVCCDVLRAALAGKDAALADAYVERLMAGNEAKRIFNSVRELMPATAGPTPSATFSVRPPCAVSTRAPEGGFSHCPVPCVSGIARGAPPA